MDFLQQSEWDTATFVNYRLHDIRTKVNAEFTNGNFKRLHNLLIVWKNEITVVMNDEQRAKATELINQASKDYAIGKNPASGYDSIITFLTLVQNQGGLGIKRRVDMRGATGKR